jgi:hypothetical protein
MGGGGYPPSLPPTQNVCLRNSCLSLPRLLLHSTEPEARNGKELQMDKDKTVFYFQTIEHQALQRITGLNAINNTSCGLLEGNLKKII